jgi:hypothetical protein
LGKSRIGVGTTILRAIAGNELVVKNENALAGDRPLGIIFMFLISIHCLRGEAVYQTVVRVNNDSD